MSSGAGVRGAPHARAGGEDLEGVGAQFGGFERGFFERAGNGCVNTDAQSTNVKCQVLKVNVTMATQMLLPEPEAVAPV